MKEIWKVGLLLPKSKTFVLHPVHGDLRLSKSFDLETYGK